MRQIARNLGPLKPHFLTCPKTLGETEFWDLPILPHNTRARVVCNTSASAMRAEGLLEGTEHNAGCHTRMIDHSIHTHLLRAKLTYGCN